MPPDRDPAAPARELAPPAAQSVGLPAAAPVPLAGLQSGLGNAVLARSLASGTGAGPVGLPGATGAKMSRAFGTDLSGVRVHPDSPRAGGLRRAVTEGADVHFAAGAYAPGTAPGDRLIAHELAHVVQQRRGAGGADIGRQALEHDADRAAAAVSAGREATVALGAPAGAPQYYEGTEHEDLGNTAGGDKITVVTKNGVRLTYGEMVALSGDFYRSPEALMNAPAKELTEILRILRLERTMTDANKAEREEKRKTDPHYKENEPLLTPEQSAELNSLYEKATSTSERATHHDHTPFGDDHGHGDEDHEGHEGHDHDADEEADDDDAFSAGKKKRRMTKYGPMIGDEHVEDAGDPEFDKKGKRVKGGELPGATASFLDLADENSSHFSPENIRLNFKPKHLMAMDMGAEAWAARNPGKPRKPLPAGDAPNAAAAAQKEPAEPGAAPSARMHTTPTQQGAAPTGADPTKTVHPGPAATPTHARGAGDKPGEVSEARALMTSAFAGHFLTDAFAGGHLISGVQARKEAPKWWAGNRANVEAALARNWGSPRIAKVVAGAIPEGKIPGILLKLVHDQFNVHGPQVRNAKGTQWSTTGDANLGNSPATKAQAEAATKAARDAVQDCIQEGTTEKPYEALDYVPDVVTLPPSKDWRPIENAAKDPAVYNAVWHEAAVAPGSKFAGLIESYKTSLPGLAGTMAKKWALDKVEDVKRWGRKTWKGAGELAGAAWDKAKALGSGALEKVKEIGGGALDKLKEIGGPVLDKVREVGGGALDKLKSLGGGMLDKVRSLGGGAVDRLKAIGGSVFDKAKQIAGGARDLGSGVIDKARQLGSGALEKAEELGSGALEKAKDIGGGAVDKLKSLGSGIAGWFGEKADAAREGLEAVKTWGADKVGGLIEKAKGIGKSISGGAKDIADKAVELFRAGKRKAAGWVGEKLDELTGGGKEGAAPSETGRVSEVGNQTYAHGGFMGAGPAFMKDAKWSAIFKELMPAEHARISKIAEPDKVVLALENNPVLAAYGSVRHLQQVTAASPEAKPDAAHKALPLEWDVWLPPAPQPVTDLSAVKIAHGNLGTTVGQGVAGDDPVGYARKDVKDAPSAGGWMDLYGKAVAMYRGAEAGGQPANAEDRQAKLKKLKEGTSGGDALAVVKEFLGSNGGLILDIKSTYSTPADVAAFVAFLKGQGINVFGVGTFKPEQLDKIEAGVRRVRFFHGLGDLERASAGLHGGGELKEGDDVMFNGGSLLSGGPEYLVAGEHEYEVDQGAYQRLLAIQRRLKLNIGLYVQENAASRAAIQALTVLVNRNPTVFSRGFAYGNVSGEAEEKVAGSGMGAQRWMNW